MRLARVPWVVVGSALACNPSPDDKTRTDSVHLGDSSDNRDSVGTTDTAAGSHTGADGARTDSALDAFEERYADALDGPDDAKSELGVEGGGMEALADAPEEADSGDSPVDILDASDDAESPATVSE